jgi:eukaryotic-like serine/threonine-protein kinase
MNRQNSSGSNLDSESSQWNGLLVRLLEAWERGDLGDLERMRHEHPEHADSIFDFLNDQAHCRDVLGTIRDDTPQLADSATVQWYPRDSVQDDSQWSLTSLRSAKFPVRFGDYSLLSEIGRGGMGIVFKAEHRTLNRVVALKVMRSGELSNEEELARFRVEAESSAAIEHPNIVSIYEVGEARGLTYYTMAFVDGENLSALIRRQSLGFKESARVVARIADAVEAAHRIGIIHRDLKPSNILIDRAGDPYLIDFGLAKGAGTNQGLTANGQILGTPAYMAPEQARCEDLTPATDIYSLGAVLYELAAGQAPFSGPTPVDILLQVLNLDPPLPRKVNPQVPRALAVIISRAMDKEPSRRYGSARAMQDDLRRFILDEPIQQPQPSWIERVNLWWRREPILVSHLSAILAVLLIVLISKLLSEQVSQNAPWVITLLLVWAAGSYLFQQLSISDRYQTATYWGWAAFDVVVYTTLIFIADPPRALLLIGYPMMIAASGLLYRVRFVVFVTAMCIAGFTILLATVNDSLAEKPEFCVIYTSGLVVLALCLISMIRRVRGLADYFACGR